MARWLRSERAFGVFYCSACVVVCMGIFMIFMLTPWFQYIEAQPRADLLMRILVSPVAVLAPPATLIILFGMMAFCVREDDSPVSVKILWFVLFFATACFGAVAYFFTVYTKRVERVSKPATS